VSARVVLYSRPGCHLCEDARAVVEHVAGDSLNPGATYSLDAVCDKLGLDVARVQARAAQLRG